MKERFWDKVDFGNSPRMTCCWLWTGHTVGKGYGRFRLDGRMQLAHRVAYELDIGPIPDGMVVRHLCDVPACVNPAHLELGTQRGVQCTAFWMNEAKELQNAITAAKEEEAETDG